MYRVGEWKGIGQRTEWEWKGEKEGVERKGWGGRSEEGRGKGGKRRGKGGRPIDFRKLDIFK